MSGLIVFDIGVTGPAPGPATLKVFAPGDRRPALEKTLALTREPQTFWIAAHGHLLDDGTHTVRFDLVDDRGQTLAQRAVEVQVRNQGDLAEATRQSLRRAGVPFATDVCDSGSYDYDDAGLAAWHDRPAEAVDAHLARLAASGAATADEIDALRHFVLHGYLVLPDAIDAAELARLNTAVDEAVAQKLEGFEWGASQRLHDLHSRFPAIHDLWTHPRVLRMLELIFDARPRPYQSLTYVFGSEQLYHQDTIALTPFPAGRMCGVWTALEDIQPDSGELMIYPGSHRLPRVYMRDVGLAKVTDDWTAFGEALSPLWGEYVVGKIEPTIYRPKAGTVLIWHENLMHAGRVRVRKDLTRRSIVGHYFADGCIAYHDNIGIPGVWKTPAHPAVA